ncbi:MAG: biotin carboxylase [Acidimicrobiales bacterium]|nr:biotin carboxylase [Acidimicrobiales bacterium]
MTNADHHLLTAPLIGTVLRLPELGETIAAGQPVVVIESMKMEHVVATPEPCRVTAVLVAAGDQVADGQGLVRVQYVGSMAHPPLVDEETANGALLGEAGGALHVEEVLRRRGFGLDQNRQTAVAKRHASGRRTARENIAHLCDADTFVEYGPLVLAAQRQRRTKDELIVKTPADGLVGGIGAIRGVRCVVMTYDYMVLAGTQGYQNHRKKDRLFELAERLELPVVILTEGGGGRPGDTDGVTVAGLDCLAFALLAKLTLTLPVIGINTGYCFAGNAALFGMCDIRISTEDSYVGMAGPAMIEGGGMGVVAPREIGPVADQTRNGVIDIVVADDAAAVESAQQILAFAAGKISPSFERPDSTGLALTVPANRRQVYDMRRLLAGVFDMDSTVELRPDFGKSVITAMTRLDGRPLVVVASNSAHLGGAIDADAASTISRMLALAQKYELPVAFFCDTPGFMVGPHEERAGLVKAAGDLFVAGAALSVPFITVVTRKGYGLGAQALAGGSFKAPVATIGWPTSEFGAMGLEGFVKLGFRDELAAIEDDGERELRYQEMVAKMYEAGKGLSMADHFEIDDVIPPAETAKWLQLLFSQEL